MRNFLSTITGVAIYKVIKVLLQGVLSMRQPLLLFMRQFKYSFRFVICEILLVPLHGL